MRNRFLMLTTATAATLMLAACGGDGGGSAAVPATTISGSAVKGPVNGATVIVRNAATGAEVGRTTTSATGLYSLSVDFQGDVVIEVSGGTYDDEATPGVDSTALTTTMRTVLTANGGTVTGVVTPLTTMAYTAAFGTTGRPTASAFNTSATSLASQFQLSGVNLSTTTPVVTGDRNDYGRVLAAVSQYLRDNNVTLATLTNTSFSTTQWGDFSAAFTAAYRTAVPNSTVTFSFTGNTVNVGGTGAGGGTGTCGVNVQGTVTANGFTVPLNLDYCINGIAAGSCTSGNSSLSQALSGQQGVAGAANLNYTYSATCAANAFVITLQ
jgi:hypothetical protein